MTGEIFSFKNHAENDVGRLVPELFLFFKKALHEVKASDLQLSFKYISIALSMAYKEYKLYKTLDYWQRDILNL